MTKYLNDLTNRISQIKGQIRLLKNLYWDNKQDWIEREIQDKENELQEINNHIKELMESIK